MPMLRFTITNSDGHTTSVETLHPAYIHENIAAVYHGAGRHLTAASAVPA